MLFTQEALGTILKIEIFGTINESRIKQCFDTVFLFEKKYSRFIKGNYLDKLNTSGQALIDAEMKTLIKAAKSVYDITSGEFDITLLPILENMGYGRELQKLKENTGMENILVRGDRVTLANQVRIDLGGVGKGYLIDKVYALLEKECDEFVIDFGGDIKVRGEQVLGLEDPLDAGKVIGKIEVENMSLCASSGEKRKLEGGHHLLSGKTRKSQTDKLAVYTTHKLAIMADMYATALYVCPLEQSIEVLEKVKGLEALIISRDGDIYKSTGFEVKLY